MSHSHSARHERVLPRGVSFSWKRALGISRVQAEISRDIGVPLSRAGRERKIGHLAPRIIGVMALIIVGLVAALIVRDPAALKAVVALIRG